MPRPKPAEPQYPHRKVIDGAAADDAVRRGAAEATQTARSRNATDVATAAKKDRIFSLVF
jgi:hypothetical protein